MRKVLHRWRLGKAKPVYTFVQPSSFGLRQHLKHKGFVEVAAIESYTIFVFLHGVNDLQLHTLLEQASRFRDEGRYLHAIQVLNSIILRQPSCDRAYVILAQVYSEMDRPDQAEKILVKGLNGSKENLEFALLLGNLHMQQRDYERALQYFGKLKHLNIPQIHQSLGYIYLDRGSLPEAEQELRLAVQADPDLPKVHELLGETLLREGKSVEAAEVLAQALHLDPYSALAHNLNGKLIAQQGEWSKAFDEFALAIDCDPDDFEAWYLAGVSLTHQEKLSEARKYFEHALERNPNSWEVREALSLVLVRLGEPEAASLLQNGNEMPVQQEARVSSIFSIHNTL